MVTLYLAATDKRWAIIWSREEHFSMECTLTSTYAIEAMSIESYESSRQSLMGKDIHVQERVIPFPLGLTQPKPNLDLTLDTSSE